ncbi:serine protease Do [Rhizobium sp. SG_E_25_P2]|uniref:Do family serine endopeptidase n=1 Tax=Rhizobium sp. SG_E_25_P2 TaxID=2879942 RepID=UPI00247609B4|nr:Do family serine endopeptidase [Rhizobium sp. SG_E_25_P2]MDH6267850.1 serine protease Do [Rhizobium sp. SG_E_25_P2]
MKAKAKSAGSFGARRAIALVATAAIACATALSPAALHAQDAAAKTPDHGPESVADLAESLTDAVVNIAILQNAKADGEEADQGFPSPNLPEGSPFQDLFDDYFKKKDGGSDSAEKVSSLGSGFVVDPAGYIVTNNHVIEGATDIEVNFANGSKLKAKLVGADTKTDLAVLKVEPKKPLRFVRLGDSRQMRIGDWVMAIGNPFGLGGSVSVGIISARNRNINAGPYDNFIQTDAAINRGNSGGPLFNMHGDVIGINTAIISPTGGSIGIGFAVPTEIAANVVNQLRLYGETRRGWLGVRIQPVTDDMIETLKLETAHGALISGVIKGGPVDNGVVKIGDIVLKLDGFDVREMRDLTRIVAESPIGKPLDMVILRDGKEMTVKVTLARQPEEDAKKKTEEAAKAKAEPESGSAPGDDKPAEPTASDTLGLAVAALTPENRKAMKIAETVEGVLVLDAPEETEAYAKGVRKGDVIVEVAQDFVDTPEELAQKLAELRENDRRNAYLMIANAKGELRLVAVPLE